MAKSTEEQKRQRAAKCALRSALEAEADDRRRRERDEQWKREGTRLTWAEYAAGEPCRGCGQPMTDELGSWPPLMKLSEAEKREYEEADKKFRERHADCRNSRWTVSGSRLTHCCFCCPPPPLGPKQVEKLARLFASGPSREERKKDLDSWDLTLRCDHVVACIQHRENTHVSTRVVECPECGERRGVVSSERAGPAYRDDETIRERAAASRERLAQELTAAEAKLTRQQKNAAATQRRIAGLQEQLGSEP
ncbi:hypothetical protein J8N05_32530 [Streptomyces sp. BH-SS-21]|uniref:Uncharacterized protein n=1 Tax=Streptomyces liliiviolaceus TaxID=2823109 RepID=A0A941BC71_9ACTN|nr:hypothetical protein [Streptomyces liliiviolaceus]MBQ0852898.1 hypothetical protein [Streptomyces liliiviolaceus]